MCRGNFDYNMGMQGNERVNVILTIDARKQAILTFG